MSFLSDVHTPTGHRKYQTRSALPTALSESYGFYRNKVVLSVTSGSEEHEAGGEARDRFHSGQQEARGGGGVPCVTSPLPSYRSWAMMVGIPTRAMLMMLCRLRISL